MSEPGDLRATLAGLDLAVPTRLASQLEEAVRGDFEIIRLIARGGMGLVFLARDLTLNREVAIKVLLADAFTTKSEVERFKLEAQTVAALTHPNIVPVFSVREHDDLLLYIMQYVDGDTLEQIIERGPVAPDQVISILAMVGEALAHAHEKGIVHRDVKPANIIIDGTGRAYVMDFGIAKVPQKEGLTIAGSLVGTPNYASPEQCRSEPVVPASDQYSLGIVAYEMLTGTPPFASNTMGGIIQHHLVTEPPDVATACPDCPAKLAHAIQRMLAKLPAARWKSLTQAIDYLTDGVSSPGRPITIGRLPGGGIDTGRDDPSDPARNGAPATGSRWIAVALVVLLFGAGGVAAWALGYWPGDAGPRPGPGVTAETEAPSGEGPDVGPDDAPLVADTGSEGAEEPGLAGNPPTPVDTDPDDTDPEEMDPDPSTPPPAQMDPEPPTTEETGGEVPLPTTPVGVVGPPGTVLIGTRGLAAVLYIDGVPQGAAARLRRWPAGPGQVELSLRVDGCGQWDSTVVVPPEGEVRIGYRLQDCGAGR